MKKSALPILACLFANLLLTAQNAPKTARPQIGLVIGLDENYRILFESKSSPGLNEARDRVEKPATCGRLGLDFWLPVHEKWAIHTGFRAASQGYVLKDDDNLVWGSEIISGVKDPSLPHNVRFVEKHFFVEIPVAAEFVFFEKKQWRAFIEPGISTLFYLKTRKFSRIGKAESTGWADRDLPKIHLMATASVGAERTIGGIGRSSVFSQLVFRGQFTRFYKSASLREYPINLGILAGLKHRI